MCNLRKISKVAFAGTKDPVERYYNTHRKFPDFLDIKKLVLLAHEQDNIVMVPIKEQQMAMNVFQSLAKCWSSCKSTWWSITWIIWQENNQYSAEWRAIQKFFLVQEDKEREKAKYKERWLIDFRRKSWLASRRWEHFLRTENSIEEKENNLKKP